MGFMLRIFHRMISLTVSLGLVYGYLLNTPALAQVSTTCPKFTQTQSDGEKIASYLPESTGRTAQVKLRQAMIYAGIKPLIVSPPTGPRNLSMK